MVDDPLKQTPIYELDRDTWIKNRKVAITREAMGKLDIVDVLRFWEGHDDVPEDLLQYLAVAADEIAGLREENRHLHKVINDAEPRF